MCATSQQTSHLILNNDFVRKANQNMTEDFRASSHIYMNHASFISDRTWGNEPPFFFLAAAREHVRTETYQGDEFILKSSSYTPSNSSSYCPCAMKRADHL